MADEGAKNQISSYSKRPMEQDRQNCRSPAVGWLLSPAGGDTRIGFNTIAPPPSEILRFLAVLKYFIDFV
jgi:hypothetical protein